MSANIHFERAAVAGVIGTSVMPVVELWVAPLMGIPAMNPAQMLAGAMGGLVVVGWLAHFMIGTALAILYAFVAHDASTLPSPSARNSSKV